MSGAMSIVWTAHLNVKNEIGTLTRNPAAPLAIVIAIRDSPLDFKTIAVAPPATPPAMAPVMVTIAKKTNQAWRYGTVWIFIIQCPIRLGPNPTPAQVVCS